MALSTFNKLTLSAPLPANFQQWNPVGHMFGSKWRGVIPDSFYPLSVVAVGTDIGGTLMLPDYTSTSGISLPIWTALGALQALEEGASGGGLFYYTGYINLTRNVSRGSFDGKEVYEYGRSPKFGFQIGSQIKNQAYISVKSMGIALKMLGTVQWIRFDTISQIEYATNSRLKRLYLDHGKISINKISINEYSIKLHDKKSPPSSDFLIEGTLDIWSLVETINDDNTTSSNYEKNSFELSSVEFSPTGELILDVGKFPNIEKIKNGDFFKVSKPWVMEDPALLFEYGLNKSTGFYNTQNQNVDPQSELKVTIQGVWFQSEKQEKDDDGNDIVLNLWNVYTDLSDSQFVLPSNFEQEKMVGESMEKAGGLKEGLKLLDEAIASGQYESARISVCGVNSKTSNYAADCLLGEFIKIGDDYFEIVGHPRHDTIDVKIKAINSKNNLNDVMSFNFASSTQDLESITIFQQKFWFINELYFNYPYQEGLWQGKIIENPSQSNTSTLIKITTRDVLSTLINNPVEQRDTGAKYLTERFYKKFSLPTDSGKENLVIDNYYKKYDDWWFYSMSTNKTYKIIDATFTETPSSDITAPTIQIDLVLDGNLTSTLKKNDEGYIFIGEPFQTYSGWHGEMSAFVEISPSLGTDRLWKALLYGNYYAGTYFLPEKSTAPFYLSSYSFGQMSGERDVPAPYISGPGKNLSICSCVKRNGANNKDCVFFLDTESKVLVMKQGSCLWKSELSQRPIYAGDPMIKDVSDKNGFDDLKNGPYYIIEMTYAVKDENNKYWFVRPSEDKSNLKTKFGLSNYESYYIFNGNTAYSDLISYYNLENERSVGSYMPFEFTSSKKNDEVTVTAQTYFPSNAIGSGECVEKEGGKNALLSILKGNNNFPRGKQYTDLKQIKYVGAGYVVKNIDYFFAYSPSESSIMVYYNKKSEINLAEFDSDGKTNPARPIVYVLLSDNNSEYFYAPSADPSRSANAGAPLMILYDFDLRGMCFNRDESMAFLFGYTYQFIAAPEDGETPVDDSKKMILAMYSFNLRDLFTNGNTYLGRDASSKAFLLARFPSLKKPDNEELPTTEKNVYGTPIYKFGHEMVEMQSGLEEDIEENQKPNEPGQNMIEILNKTNATFNEEQLSVSVDSTGRITLFVYVEKISDKNVSGIISLTSSDNGMTWNTNNYDSGDPIVYSNHSLQRNPYQLGSLLFLIDAAQNALIVKDLSNSDLTKYSIVAIDVSNHNISGIIKENGVIYVYYYSKTGNVISSASYDKGNTWEPLANW